MALLECEVTLHTPRIYRDPDGRATGIFILGEGYPAPVEGAQDEPVFSGESYVRFELFLDNTRGAETLRDGGKLRLTVDVPDQGGE